MPSKFKHLLDPMPHPGATNKKITFSFDDTVDTGVRSEVAQSAANHISKAQKHIETTLTVLQYSPKAAEKWLKAFFFCDLSEKATIIAKFKLIQTGLNRDQRIKIGNIPFRENEKADGAVKVVQKPAQLNRKRSYYNTVNSTTYGAIYFDPAAMKQDIGPRLVVHEASHKYGGTSDYFYLSPMGLGDSQFKLEPTKIYKQYDQEEQALDNADSYAWLCYKLAQFGSD